jgi:hypothetical protein
VNTLCFVSFCVNGAFLCAHDEKKRKSVSYRHLPRALAAVHSPQAREDLGHNITLTFFPLSTPTRVNKTVPTLMRTTVSSPAFKSVTRPRSTWTVRCVGVIYVNVYYMLLYTVCTCTMKLGGWFNCCGSASYPIIVATGRTCTCIPFRHIPLAQNVITILYPA